MRIFQFAGAVLGAALLAACASGPVVIPDDITAEELIQRGQESSDRNRYKQSLQYYEAILERFRTNTDLICAAEYEIAFIHYKQKLYARSRSEFEELLVRYDDPDAELLPPQFKILAEIVLKQIAEKENAPLLNLPFLKKKNRDAQTTGAE
jgi:outer membrane protein assembly factor BamD (BamD/ComL family)